MRDLTQSMMSFSWAMSLFGLKQLTSIMAPGLVSEKEGEEKPLAKATQAFNTVSEATQEQFDKAFQDAFKTGEQMQKGILETMMPSSAFKDADVNTMMRIPTDIMQRFSDVFGTSTQQKTAPDAADEGI